MKTALHMAAVRRIVIALASTWFAANAAGDLQTQSERTATGNGVTVKTAGQYETWTKTENSGWVSCRTGESRIHDVAFGNGTFVIVGNEGALLTARDGVSWTKRNAGTDERLRGITFGNGTFVVVGYDGVIRTSTDGIKWRIQNSHTRERLQKVIFRDGIFVAVGWSGVILTSPNGKDWTKRNSGITERLISVEYQTNLFYASAPNRVIRVSTDAVRWDSPPASGTDLTLSR